MSKITEGLRESDLADLVNNVIEMDTFEAKVDEDAIVIAFFVDDQDPAKDLSRFIEKGGLEILDAEVSPAPDEEGRYAVFVEFIRNKDFPKNAMRMIDAIEALTAIHLDAWEVKAYKEDKPFPLTTKNIRKYIRLEQGEEPEKMASESAKILHFLKDSLLEDAYFSESYIILERLGVKRIFSVAGFGPSDAIFESHFKGMPFDLTTTQELTKLSWLLGENWVVSKINDNFILSYPDKESVLALIPA